MSSEAAAPAGQPVQPPPERKLPQLRMQFRAYAALAPVRLPSGHTLATLAQRDTAEWVAVLAANAQLGTWDERRAHTLLTGERPVLAAGTYLILAGERAVATACTVPPTATEPRSELGWVAVTPDHQGRGLGLRVCSAVLWYARREGWPATTLSTDDWRLPAIRTYLKLGFEPELTHDSHAARWQEVHRRLAAAPAAQAQGGEA